MTIQEAHKLRGNFKKGDKFRFNGHTYKIIKLYGYFALCDNGLYLESFMYDDMKAIKAGRKIISERGKRDGQCKNPRRVRT